MKKIVFLAMFFMMVGMSCTKEVSFIYPDKPKDSTFIYVDYKPMEKGVIPDEGPKN